MLTYRVSDNVALRTGTPAKSVEPVEYEKHVYQQGLKFERPPFTFQTDKWQGQAEERMSAESKGYVRMHRNIVVSDLKVADLCDHNSGGWVRLLIKCCLRPDIGSKP